MGWSTTEKSAHSKTHGIATWSFFGRCGVALGVALGVVLGPRPHTGERAAGATATGKGKGKGTPRASASGSGIARPATGHGPWAYMGIEGLAKRGRGQIKKRGARAASRGQIPALRRKKKELA